MTTSAEPPIPATTPAANGPGGARLGEILVAEGVAPEKVESALVEQRHLKESRREQEAEATSSIMIASRNLDNLVNLIGDLITLQSRLNQLTATHPDQEMLAITRGIEQLSSVMRDTTMYIRRMAVGVIYNHLRRPVKEAAEATGKELDLLTEGTDLEMDKTVIERLNRVLIDLTRFCVLRDLETPTERERKLKRRKGTLRVKAAPNGGQILVQLTTDGRGFDAEVIKTRAETLGLIGPLDHPTSEELFDFLFHPGFLAGTLASPTGEKGVEPDLADIKQAVDEMRGAIEMANGAQGGLEIRITVPESLAIFHGFLVTVQGRYFLFPLFSVQECLGFDQRDRHSDGGNDLILVRGEMIPYLSLRSLLQIEGERPAVENIVITNVNRRRVGFVVDHVVGEFPTVIKPLGRFLEGADKFLGAAILGDGTIALILHLTRLVEADTGTGNTRTANADLTDAGDAANIADLTPLHGNGQAGQVSAPDPDPAAPPGSAAPEGSRP